jgi:hypothetical protein
MADLCPDVLGRHLTGEPLASQTESARRAWLTMPAGFTESDAEGQRSAGWRRWANGQSRPEIAYNADGGECAEAQYRDTILQNRLHLRLTRLNSFLHYHQKYVCED